MIHIEREYINLNRKIDVKSWERFEELADLKERLWQVFWSISQDKNEIEVNKICKHFYFSKFVIKELYDTIHELTAQKIADKNDIEIIFSLYLKMIPNCRCEECDCETNLEKDVNIRENSKN